MNEINPGGSPHKESIHDLAPLYAIEALGADETRQFEEHLQEGCPHCEDTLPGYLAAAADLATTGPFAGVATHPPEGLRDRILASIHAERAPRTGQVWKNWSPSQTEARSYIRRQDDGDWEPTGFRGVSVRRLFYDPIHDQVTMLIRMEPGTAYPPHRHAGPEECYVLEGDLRVGDTIMHSGDYQRVAADSRHPVQTTENGCLLYITSSAHDELLV